MAPEVVKKTIAICNAHHLPIVMEGPGKYWMDAECWEKNLFWMQSLGEDSVIINGYSDEIRVNKFSAVIPPDADIAVKEAAECVTADIHQDGICHALEYYGLI